MNSAFIERIKGEESGGNTGCLTPNPVHSS